MIKFSLIFLITKNEIPINKNIFQKSYRYFSREANNNFCRMIVVSNVNALSIL